MKTVRHNFHVPLSDDIYQLLRAEAQRLQQPATVIARNAITWWLEKCQQEALYDSIRAYAEHEAGTDADLDTELEQATIEHIVAEDQQN